MEYMIRKFKGILFMKRTKAAKQEKIQTTRSKGLLIEFILAEKVAWDNLAVMASFHLVWEFLRIFQLLNVFFLMGSGTRPHKKICFESKNPLLIRNSFFKNAFPKLQSFRFGGL